MPRSADGFRVVTGHAEDHPIAVEHHPDLGLLGGRLAVVGIALQEAGGRQRLLPRRLVRRTVDDNRLTVGEAIRPDLGPAGLCGHRDLHADDKRHQNYKNARDQATHHTCMASLTFLGAARTVTGSKHLRERGGRAHPVRLRVVPGLERPEAAHLQEEDAKFANKRG